MNINPPLAPHYGILSNIRNFLSCREANLA